MTAAVTQCLPSSAEAAQRLAARLGVGLHEIALHRFPDGELRVTVGPAASTVIVYASLNQPNDKLLALLFASEALRRGGAKRLVLVAPYLCYMRQDAAFHEGEAVSQKVIGRLLASAVDRLITVDAHLHRTKDIYDIFSGIEADNLSAMPAIADGLRASGFDPNTVVVGPDEESQAWVSETSQPGSARSPRWRARPGAAIVRSKLLFSIRGCSPGGRPCWLMTSFRRAAR